MIRRAFLALAAAGIAVPGAFAQALTRRIAWLSTSGESDARQFLDALESGLRDLGYTEGRGLLLERHWANDSAQTAAQIAARVVASRPDVIVTLGPSVFAVSKMTRSIPVVFGFSGDPVEAKLVRSLSRPGGNLTGISFLTLELVGKRLELLREVMPGLRRVGVIANPQHPGDRAERRVSDDAARQLGLELVYSEGRSAEEIASALAALARSAVEAIVVFPFATIMTQRERIARWSVEQRIPAVSGWAQFADGGNLMSYGPNLRLTLHRLASFVDKVLKGTNPAGIPIELPPTVELVINTRAAAALGIAIPSAVLLRADRVIE